MPESAGVGPAIRGRRRRSPKAVRGRPNARAANADVSVSIPALHTNAVAISIAAPTGWGTPLGLAGAVVGVEGPPGPRIR